MLDAQNMKPGTDHICIRQACPNLQVAPSEVSPKTSMHALRPPVSVAVVSMGPALLVKLLMQ